MKNGYFIAWLLLATPTLAQPLKTRETWPLNLLPGQSLRVDFDQPYTSALLNVPTAQVLDKAALVADGDTLWLRRDPHATDGQASVLCVFRRPVRYVTVLPGTARPASAGLSGPFELVSFYVPPLPAGYVQAQMRALAARKGEQTECEKPTVVPVSVWRQGLTPPKEPPVQTKVQFVIVHHSATSNIATDYVEEVRNIYVFHTTDGRFNDIGYNFLMGRDGVIYEGRDGQGRMDGDNVLGAHFCSTNTGTMGVCLLGNFNDVQPSEASLKSLNQLISWKLKKEGLTPLSSAPHASSGRTLNLISGHRDGVCATECPGNNLYARLGQLRQEVSQSCSFTLIAQQPLAVENEADWVVFPNPADGPVWVRYQTQTPEQVRFEWVDARGRSGPLRAVAQNADTWRIELQPGQRTQLLLRCMDGNRAVVRTLWRVDSD